VYLRIHPETMQHVAGGKARQGTASEIISFAKDTAAKTGVSKRTVQHDVQIGEKIADDVNDIKWTFCPFD